jgi:hypothetical protein
MASLSSNKVIFDSTSTDVIGSLAPDGLTIGIEKGSEQTGFFVYSVDAYNLWFKDSNGNWGLYQTITEPMADGRTYPWGNNVAVYIQTSTASPRFYVFRRTGALEYDSDPTDGVDSADTMLVKDQSEFNIMAPGGDQATVSIGVTLHGDLEDLGWTASGHIGNAYSVVMFDASGNPIEIAAPASGSREGKVLQWISNTELAWVAV